MPACALRVALGAAGLALLLLGGLLYTVGAVLFAGRRPDPVPAHFGSQEVFHPLAVAAAACHIAVVVRAVGRLG